MWDNILGHHNVIENIEKLLSLLKRYTRSLCDQLKQAKSEIFIQNFTEIELIDDLDMAYSTFYYDNQDPIGNTVNTYYGYIFSTSSESIIETVSSVNMLKDQIGIEIKNLRNIFKSNPPKFNKIIASIDTVGRLNLKEVKRHIVIIESYNSPVIRVSFQPEITTSPSFCPPPQSSLHRQHSLLVRSPQITLLT